MKQIPSQTFTAIGGVGDQPVVTAYVPAGSWANNKVIMIRAQYHALQPPGGPNTDSDIHEKAGVSPTTINPYHHRLVLHQRDGEVTWEVVRQFRRDNNTIWFWDAGAMFYRSLDQGPTLGAPAFENTIFDPLIPIDFTSEIPLTMYVDLTPFDPSLTLDVPYCQAMMEQPINLGRLG